MGALETADPALYAQIQPAYDAAKAKGLYEGQYAENTIAEYWAEGTQWWFWSNIEFFDRETKARVQTPADLEAYDPTLCAILEKVYLGHHIPADISSVRLNTVAAKELTGCGVRFQCVSSMFAVLS